MRFYAFGFNHESASLGTVEAFALDPEAQSELYGTVELSDRSEVVFLSTCNRTEVYLYGEEGDLHCVRKALREHAGNSWPREEAILYTDEAAVHHVLEVATGIRSRVTGDSQIFAQLKEAYRRAVDYGGGHSVMHRLMHAVFRAAKRVAKEVDLSRGPTSAAPVAVEMVKDYFAEDRGSADLEGISVLVVGAGAMGRLALNALDEAASATTQITNRTSERADALAAEHGAESRAWDQRHEAARESDVVIVATGASESVMEASSFPASPKEAVRSTLFVDLSMPRGVDPVLEALKGCVVFDLDDLQAWHDDETTAKEPEVSRAKTICEEERREFVSWVFDHEALRPAIHAIRETFDTIRKREVQRHAHRTDMNREEVERLTKSIMQKVLAVPTVRLKRADPEGLGYTEGVQLLEALFGPSSEEEGCDRFLPERPDSHVPSLSDSSKRPFETGGHTSGEGNCEVVERALRMGDRVSN